MPNDTCEYKNPQKIGKNPGLDLKGSFPVPSNVLGSSQNRPRVLQDAKVEAPSMPNDTHGDHKPENWLQKFQESSIQEPASQQTFRQRSLIKQKTNQRKPTTPISHKTDQNLKS